MWASSSEVVGWDGAEVGQGRNMVFVGFPVTSGGAILSPRWLSTGHMGNVGLAFFFDFFALRAIRHFPSMRSRVVARRTVRFDATFKFAFGLGFANFHQCV
jgi:hypothetical protein